jgi:cell division protein FtsB
MNKKSIILVLIVLSVSLNFSLYKSIVNYSEKQKYVQQINNKLQNEINEHKKLVSEYAKSQDYAEIEYTIREKLNLIKPGEKVYIIDRPSPTLTPTPTIYLIPVQKWLRLIW